MSDQEKLNNLKSQVSKKKTKKKAAKKKTVAKKVTKKTASKKKSGRTKLSPEELRRRKIQRDRDRRARIKAEKEKNKIDAGQSTVSPSEDDKKGDAAYPHVNNPPENDTPTAKEQGVHDVTVTLQARHYVWLEYMAGQEKRSLESMLEKLVRSAYAMDPTKGGTVNVMTQEQIDALKNS